MPTKRAIALFIFAIVFYLLANQTQVGWVYIFANILTGFLIVAFFYSRRTLWGVAVTRHLQPIKAGLSHQIETLIEDDLEAFETALTFHEDDEIMVTLQVSQRSWKPAFLVSGQEFCPFAPPVDQAQPFFLPMLFRSQPLTFAYQTTCDRRGIYTFSRLSLQSNGPFGLFKEQHTVPIVTATTIYPAYHPVRRLRALERRALAERPTQRTGVGSQVIGTRDYRAGDSLRLMHWRSTARTGNLVVKEFADDDDLALTVVLDLYQHSSQDEGKFSTFETAVRLAASFGYYATQKQLPFFLAGQHQQGAPPRIALSWWRCLYYLASVKNDGNMPLDQYLSALGNHTFYVILVSHITNEIAKSLRTLQRCGTQMLPIFITSDGILPPEAAGMSTAVSVSPHNWRAVLDQL